MIFEHTLVYKQIEYKENAKISSINANGKDKWFLTHENIIVEFHFIVKKNGNYFIRGSALKNTRNFFTKPFESKRLSIFLSDGELRAHEFFEFKTIKAKMFCLPYKNEWVFIPLLHTL